MFGLRIWVFCAGLLVGVAGQVFAQPWQPHVRRMDWWRNTATLDMDFAHNRYMVSLTAPVTYTSLTQFITAVSGTFTRAGANETASGDPFYLGANQSFVSRATSTTQLTATGSPFYADASQAFYSRASTGTYFDSSGVMQTAASNVARADYDPLTLAYKGVLIEPARTNYISNSTMQWSGSWPSGWSAVNYGVTPTVVASGTISGMNYIDVQFLGVGDTVSSASSQRYTNIHFGSSVNTSGNTAWATSAYIGYVSGSYPTGTYKSARLLTALATSASYLGELNYAQGSVLNYTGALRRVGTVGTTTSATVFVRPYFQLAYDQGEAVNLTLRFAAPQMEMGASSTSFIPTTSAPVTRAADVYTQQTASYFDSTGTLKFATAGAARGDYHPSTLAYRGILAEPARTNLVKYSSQPGSASWYYQPSYTTITADSAVAPDGTLTADRVSTTAYMVAPGLGVVSDTTYTFSVWLKSPTGLSQGYGLIVEDTVPGDANLLLASSTVVANGSWQRFSISATAPTQTSNFRVSVRNGDYYMWGAQVEAGTTPSSYIPTWASTASRAADVYTAPNSGTYFDSTGTLRNAPANTPRLDYDPSTTEPKGILIEEARTNVVRNSGMIGAGSGVSATLPNNWFLDVGSVPFNYSISGTGVEQGIPFLDIRFWGTSSGGTFALNYEQASTGTGSIWTGTHFVRVIGGSLNNLTLQTGLYFYIPSETAVLSVAAFIASDSALAVQRSSVTATAPSGTTAVRPRLRFSAASGAFDVTLRIGGPQLEQGSFPTSYIPTSGSSVTRPSDTLCLSTSGWYNSGAGSVYGDFYGEGDSTGSARVFSIGSASPLTFNNSNSNLIHWPGAAGVSGVTASRPISASIFVPMRAIATWDDSGPLAKLSAQGLVAHSGSYIAGSYAGPTACIGQAVSKLYYLNSWVRRIGYFPNAQPDYSLPDYTR